MGASPVNTGVPSGGRRFAGDTPKPLGMIGRGPPGEGGGGPPGEGGGGPSAGGGPPAGSGGCGCVGDRNHIWKTISPKKCCIVHRAVCGAVLGMA